jgi:hypothetical protein
MKKTVSDRGSARAPLFPPQVPKHPEQKPECESQGNQPKSYCVNFDFHDGGSFIRFREARTADGCRFAKSP